MRPNDPLYPEQWHLHVMQMEQVWDVEIGSPEVIIAVVESGFDVGHPDLRNQIHKCVNTFGPHDHMLSEHPTNVDAQDDHGTHMLGLIAAEMNNGEGGCGVAPGCRLLPIKIANNLSDDDIALGIRTAVNEGARVVNLSNVSYYPLGKRGEPVVPRQACPPPSDALLRACEYAVEHHVLICSIITGNQGFFGMDWPAAYHAGLNVSQAGTDGLSPANFCVGSVYTDVMAPAGQRRASGDPDWPCGHHPDPAKGLWSTIQVKNGSYKSCSGGCMATAVASGVAGLLYSRFPGLTVAQARQVICNTARGEGWETCRGHGHINPLAIARLARVEVALEIASATAVRHGSRVDVETTVANRGVLDAKDVLVFVYANEPETARTRQLHHERLPVLRGLETETIRFEGLEMPEHTEALHVVVDPRFQLSEADRRRGLTYLKTRVQESRP